LHNHYPSAFSRKGSRRSVTTTKPSPRKAVHSSREVRPARKFCREVLVGTKDPRSCKGSREGTARRITLQRYCFVVLWRPKSLNQCHNCRIIFHNPVRLNPGIAESPIVSDTHISIPQPAGSYFGQATNFYRVRCKTTWHTS